MKLLLSWILKHLDLGSDEDIHVKTLVEKFNTHTAEIEYFEPIHISFEDVFMAKCLSEKGEFLLANKKQIDFIPFPQMHSGEFYLFKKTNSGIAPATYKDFGQDKNELLPPFFLTDEEFESGSWKKCLPSQDYVLIIDNKSMTNRPDLWSARGIAREIGCLFDYKLKNESLFLKELSCIRTDLPNFSNDGLDFENLAPDKCRGFSLTKICGVKNRSSHPYFAFKLIACGFNAINLLVDISNYVMLDWGNPVHVYDADLLDKKISVRNALKNEKIELLNSVELTLAESDLVIADSSSTLALAGIKGGLQKSVSMSTKNIVLEVANFEPVAIRKSSLSNKVRTDSSLRYEKNLDTESIPNIARRFAFFMDLPIVNAKQIKPIYFSAPPYSARKIVVEHSFIEQLAGIEIPSAAVLKILKKLEYKVFYQEDSGNYTVEVPSNRATKNVKTKYDVFEDVVRILGYDSIPLTAPKLYRQAYDLQEHLFARNLKHSLAFGYNFIEQVNYNFLDTDFLTSMKTACPKNLLTLLNPVSDNHKQLVPTLFWGLLKNVSQNCLVNDELRFFEIAKVWPEEQPVDFVTEKLMLSGILTSKDGKIDFYSVKNIINTTIGLQAKIELVWMRSNKLVPQSNQTQVAEIFCDNQVIGILYGINNNLLELAGLLSRSSGYFFELNLEVIKKLTASWKGKKLDAMSKYQYSYFDISFFLGIDKTLHEVETLLKELDDLVTQTKLLDVFEKKSQSQATKKSLTFRVFLQSPSRNIEKTEVDKINSLAIERLSKLGAEIR